MAGKLKNITKRAVDALRPGDVVWDDDVRGFGVRCQRRDKVYVLKYRFHGRQRWLSIGKHGSPWTPEKAKNEARKFLGFVADGKDPAEARDDAKKDITVSALCDLYMSEGVATKKASTIATDKGRIKRHIKPLIGKKRCCHVTRTDVDRMMQDIAKGKTAVDVKTGPRGRAIVKGGQGTATKAVTLLGAIFTFAINRGIRTDNPVHGVKTFKAKKHERFLSPVELGRLGEVLAATEVEGINPMAINAIRLLVMTGCRRGEILSLEWKHIDFERSCFRLPDTKIGARIIPVGAPVLKLLGKIPQVRGNPYVLPGDTKGKHFVGLPKVWNIIRKRAGLDGVRIHDLRHSFASVGAAGGDSLFMIGKLLGHQQSSTTARYAHLSDDPLKAAADRISGTISAALTGDGGDVVEFSNRKV